jgi:hypothetical protein
MPLKRVTPSFTVEYRQAKRSNTGSTKPDWVHAEPPPAVFDKEANRIAISAFKPVAAKASADVSLSSIAPGRILPSLVEAALVAGQVDAKGDRLKSDSGATPLSYIAQAPADTASPIKVGERVYSSENLEPSVAPSTTNRLEHSPSLDPGASKAGRTRSETRTQRPPGKRAKFDHDSGALADMSKLVTSTAELPFVDKPSLPSRTSRILDRYVFRDERGPGESWKRRIEARRERRASAPVGQAEPIGAE